MTDKKQRDRIKLRHLKVKNFKILDELDIRFPSPRMANSPDIYLMGSKNGYGKTSVLESCALLFLATFFDEKPFEIGNYPNIPINLPELLIRSGKDEAYINGIFTIDDKEFDLSIELKMNGKVKINGNTAAFKNIGKWAQINPVKSVQRFLNSLIGLNSEPLISPPYLYFHSYRKVQEGYPSLSMMIDGERMNLRHSIYRSDYEYPSSTFKLQVLRSMMGQAKLFETEEDEHAGDILKKLNDLVKRFAGGTIEKLRPSKDNTVDFRIYPAGNKKESFTFDGLSSGQKEIISTLFLIWYHTQNIPAIVLIDEPELHLNAGWHRDFVKQVFDLAPQNQYIIATHSEEIFSSVDEDRRILLEKT